MKAETQRQRGEFAAALRVNSPKDPPLLTTEAINDLCALVNRDAPARRMAVRKLLAALREVDLGTIRRLIDEALLELRD